MNQNVQQIPIVKIYVNKQMEYIKRLKKMVSIYHIAIDLKYFNKILQAFCVVVDFENENPFVKEGCFS